MICATCKTEVAPDAVYCPKCGDRLDHRTTPDGAPAAPAVNSAADGGAERLRDTLQANRGAKDASEEDLWQGGYSPKAMIGHWLGAALISVLLLVVMFVFPPLLVNFIAWAVLAGILALLWGGLGVWLLIRRLDVHYQLTSQRFIHKSGVLRRRSDRIEVIDIDDVTFEQGLVERFVGVGTIKITSSDRSHPELKMYGIDGVQQVADIIDNVRREERRRRGVHIESI